MSNSSLATTDGLQPTASLPCAHGAQVGSAHLRATPEDFIVREHLGFAPEGEGDHIMLVVRKRGANTMWVAKQLARLANVHPREVGFAGLKDRDAVTEQSFTVPARSAIGEAWSDVHGEGFAVRSWTRCRRKLKRGALKGNDFTIVLREFSGSLEALEQRLRNIAAHGVPNYFGPQRFGRDGGNLANAIAWFRGEREAPDRFERGFALSAARAALFNAVLTERVRRGDWTQLLAGDVANLNGSNSIFPIAAPDDELTRRCAALDIHPTGPMWGAGELPTAGAVREIEEQVAGLHAVLRDGLVLAGLQQERRALRIAVENLQWSHNEQNIELQFRLVRGAYATAVLHEIIDNAFAQAAPEGDD